MNKSIYLIGVFLLTAFVLPSFAQVSNDNEDEVNKIDTRFAKHDFVSGQALVKFKDANRVTVRRAQGQFASTDIDRVTEVLHKYGTQEMEQLLPNENPNRQLRRGRAFNGDTIQERDLSQLYCLKLSADHQHETMLIIEELNTLDEVEYAEPNYRAYIMGGECIADNYGTNPMYSKQWYLDAYGVTELWDKPIINSERPIIAIIDTGVDTTHPDLRDNCIEGYDFVNNTSNVIDDNMHGTHVAGIAAAANNGIGVVGANPLAFIMPIKVLDKNGSGDNATILRGVSYAVEHGAKILNLSLGGYGYSKAAADVYRNASLSAIIVAAAGNDGKCIYSSHTGLQKHGIQPAPSFPAAYSFVLGVQATNRKGELASFSNYDDDGPLFSCESSLDEPDGFNYELKAPGTEILSTLPDGNYGELQGTSMASPLAAGAISALMMVKDYETQEQLWAELLHTNNIAETYELTGLSADLDVVRIMLRERKEFSDETEEAYIGTNDVMAGETIDIYPVIRCTAGDASNIKLKLEVDDYEDPNCVQIVAGEVDFGWHLDAMGKAVSKNPLVVKIPDDIADSRHIRLKIMVSCENQEGTNSRPFTFIATNMETISGLLTENTTLHSGHSYYVNGDLAVDKNVTLTIEPGTRLEFAEGKLLTSNGKLVAKGTIEKPIVFTSHHGGEMWGSIGTRKKYGGVIKGGIYTNSEHTLFTLYETEDTPVYLSDFVEHPFYDPSSGLGNKTFSLCDYVKGWNMDKTLIENVNWDETLLTDPDFLTPPMLKMLEDFNEYLGKFGSGERSETNTNQAIVTVEFLKWKTYSDAGDTISYCIIESSAMNSESLPYMKHCIIRGCSISGRQESEYNVIMENSGGTGTSNYVFRRKCNIINNDDNYAQGNQRFSYLTECNYFNNPATFRDYNYRDSKYYGCEYWLGIIASEPEVDHADYPSYLGTSREDIVRPHVYESGNAPTMTWGIIDLSNMRTTPVPDAHGIVWKVLVNGKDPQDEYEDLAPLGVGRHKFEVYFSRPMNKEAIPLISYGVRDPWTQNGVDEDGGWNDDGTIYTAYTTITGKTKSDGENRIYVRGAEDTEFFPCPYEKTRFKINVQAAGSMATGFVAEAGLGNVKLTWNNDANDIEDAMGYNVYRYSDDIKKAIPGHYDDDWNWIEPMEIPDTMRINENILGVETNEYVDNNIIPGHTYYYFYKVISTDLKEYDISNIVAATPYTTKLGDANGSGDVDVADVITIVNYAAEKNPKPFIFEAADMNGDKTIDILDVIGVINKILHPESMASAMAEATATYTIENGMVYVESPVALAGVQVQLKIDDNSQMEDVRVADNLNGFEQTSAWLSDTDCLFLAYSMNGKTLDPGKHAILHIGDGQIVSIRLSNPLGGNVLAKGSGTTGVDRMGKDVMSVKGIYNLKGQKISESTSEFGKLPKGIYIIDGKKVIK